MIDALLLVIVIGAVLIAVAVDLGALATWLHSRWRASQAAPHQHADGRGR